MGAAAGPNIIEDGLVLYLDAANGRSFDPRENLYPHSETLQTLGNRRCTRETFTSSGPFGTGYHEFTVTTASSSNIYNFDGGDTISLTTGQVITFSAYFRNISLSGNIYLRCWSGSDRAWNTIHQTRYDLVNLTSTPTGGTILDHSISDEGGGWYRLSMTLEADKDGFSAISINVGGQVGEQYQATAVQVSNGSTLTEYLPTDGSAITRSSTWSDVSSGDNNASLQNSPEPVKETTSYFSFNGINQKTDQSVSSIDLSTDSMTIELWFRSRELPTDYIDSGAINAAIYGDSYGSNIQTFIYPEVNGKSNLGVCYDDSRGNSGHRSNYSIEANEWVQFVWIARPSYQILYYINGELDKDAFNSADQGLNVNTNWSVARDNRYGGYSKLDVGMVKRYNRELSASEIKRNFQATRLRFGI